MMARPGQRRDYAFMFTFAFRHPPLLALTSASVSRALRRVSIIAHGQALRDIACA